MAGHRISNSSVTLDLHAFSTAQGWLRSMRAYLLWLSVGYACTPPVAVLSALLTVMPACGQLACMDSPLKVPAELERAPPGQAVH
jgi:hypothetical protein